MHMKKIWQRMIMALLAGLAVGGTTMPAVAAQAHCSSASCSENPSFVVQVTDLRNSTSGRYRVLTATLRFRNKLDRPLILGYVNGSGVVTDDLGNRYLIGSNGVRGIGVLGGNAVDTKFTLAPGETSEARFEYTWEPGRAIVGTRYDMDLTVREVDAISGNQFKLGRERVLHFASAAVDRPVGAAPSAAAPAVATPAATAPPASPQDFCAGVSRCVSAGPFIAQITGATPQGGAKDRHHTLVLNVRFRNVSNEPVVLGYKASSSNGTDNLGNQYYWGRAGTYDTSAAGIGTVSSREANASFAVAPGASRDATFKLIRYNSLGSQLGTGWVYDVVISQLEILPSQQVRVGREFSLHFTDITANGIAAGAATVGDAVQDLKDIFKKKKK
jgi:hypothetical protein